MAESRWYTLHVQSGFEDRVRANIVKALQQEGLLDKVEEIFIPANERVVIKVAGKEKAVFPLKGEPVTYEVETEDGKKVVFHIENGKVWAESVETKKGCLPQKPIERIGQKIKCPELKAEAKIELRDKLYPGYMFIKADLDNRVRSTVRAVPRVLGFVSTGGEPVVVPESEIVAMRERLEKGVPKVTKLKFDKGDRVKIKEGPFIGFEGVISEIDAEREKVIVLVNIFDRQTPVELEFDQIEKVS
ncbi:transcription termination/antitermination protein NusG [Desulfurobacterium sp.]